MDIMFDGLLEYEYLYGIQPCLWYVQHQHDKQQSSSDHTSNKLTYINALHFQYCTPKLSTGTVAKPTHKTPIETAADQHLELQ